MELMEGRRMIMLAQDGGSPPPTPTIGGLIVYQDNCLYPGSNGLIDSITANNDFFLTGIIDTGNTSQKAYTVTRIGTNAQAAVRFYDNIESNSVDYWTIMRTDIKPTGRVVPYDFNSRGRYIVISVAKAQASQFYLKYRGGEYIVKGNDVTN